MFDDGERLASELSNTVSPPDPKEVSQVRQCAELDAYLTELRKDHGLDVVFVALACAIGDFLRAEIAARTLSIADADELQSGLERTIFSGTFSPVYEPQYSR